MVFTAHHDHLGLAAERDETGDNIYNGAIDNASGSAALLAIARAITNLPEKPKRSVMFAFVGAEDREVRRLWFLVVTPLCGGLSPTLHGFSQRLADDLLLLLYHNYLQVQHVSQ